MSIKRQQIMDAIKTRFQGILVASGYNFNLGSNVYEWRTTAIPESQMPALIMQDVANVKDDSGAVGKFRWSLQVEVEVVAAATAENIRKMIADVYKAIGVDHTWGGIAQATHQPESDEMQFEQNEKIIGGAKIKVSIIYDAPKWEM